MCLLNVARVIIACLAVDRQLLLSGAGGELLGDGMEIGHNNSIPCYYYYYYTKILNTKGYGLSLYL